MTADYDAAGKANYSKVEIVANEGNQSLVDYTLVSRKINMYQNTDQSNKLSRAFDQALKVQVDESV